MVYIIKANDNSGRLWLSRKGSMQGADQITLSELAAAVVHAASRNFIRCGPAIRVREAWQTYEAFVKDWQTQGRHELVFWLMWMQHVNGYAAMCKQVR